MELKILLLIYLHIIKLLLNINFGQVILGIMKDMCYKLTEQLFLISDTNGFLVLLISFVDQIFIFHIVQTILKILLIPLLIQLQPLKLNCFTILMNNKGMNGVLLGISNYTFTNVKILFVVHAHKLV